MKYVFIERVHRGYIFGKLRWGDSGDKVFLVTLLKWHCVHVVATLKLPHHQLAVSLEAWFFCVDLPALSVVVRDCASLTY